MIAGPIMPPGYRLCAVRARRELHSHMKAVRWQPRAFGREKCHKTALVDADRLRCEASAREGGRSDCRAPTAAAITARKAQAKVRA